MQKQFRFSVSLILIAVVLQFETAAAITIEAQPNIVVLLCDDLGYGDLECYGHPHVKTPNLNKMAQSGIRFTSCYSAAPVCSPSRVGLLTGRSPNRSGVFDWIPEAKDARWTKHSRSLVHMRKEEITIPQLLKKTGYATMMSGKWHCNSRFNHSAQPQPGDCGFDHWFGTQNNASPSHANPNNYVRNGTEVGPLKGYSCQLAIDEALAWLDARPKEAEQKPFFMYIAFHEPHEPVASPENLVDKYMAVAKNRKQAEYFANVENVDLAVGKLFKKLEEENILQDTLVVFTSDNGPETLDRYKNADRSFGTPSPLRGMKLWTTEAGFRVAGIAHWSGRIKSGTTIDTPVSSLDFLPTFCSLAGATLPSELALDGIDITSILDGNSAERPKPLMWAYYNALNEHRVAMRHGKWKMLAKLDLPKIQNVFEGNQAQIKKALPHDFELYDLSTDISESKNLLTESGGVPSELAQELKDLFQEQYTDLLNDSHIWPGKQ